MNDIRIYFNNALEKKSQQITTEKHEQCVNSFEESKRHTFRNGFGMKNPVPKRKASPAYSLSDQDVMNSFQSAKAKKKQKVNCPNRDSYDSYLPDDMHKTTIRNFNETLRNGDKENYNNQLDLKPRPKKLRNTRHSDPLCDVVYNTQVKHISTKRFKDNEYIFTSWTPDKIDFDIIDQVFGVVDRCSIIQKTVGTRHCAIFKFLRSEYNTKISETIFTEYGFITFQPASGNHLQEFAIQPGCDTINIEPLKEFLRKNAEQRSVSPSYDGASFATCNDPMISSSFPVIPAATDVTQIESSCDNSLNNTEDLDENEYEVEKICKHKEEKGKYNYLIKWKGYDFTENTWQPEKTLKCDEVLQEYWSTVRLQGDQRRWSLPERNLRKLIENGVTSQSEFNLHSLRLANYMDGRIIVEIDYPINSRTGLEFYRRLNNISAKWNQMCKRSGFAPLSVVNQIDFVLPILDFITVNKYNNGSKHIACQPPTFFCSEKCGKCDKICSGCCAESDAFGFTRVAYDADKRNREIIEYVKRDGLYMKNKNDIYEKQFLHMNIIECNDKCLCDKDCRNRVAQLGRQVPVTIYRTRHAGYAVRTDQAIPCGTFIDEYIGEVLSQSELEHREKKLDELHCSYLLDLDHMGCKVEFTIDAANYGNISHFFNHSCEPNMVMRAAWWSHHNQSLPHMCFFAKRDIDKDEELTFDYINAMQNKKKMGSNYFDNNILDLRKAPKEKCYCGSAKCRGFVY